MYKRHVILASSLIVTSIAIAIFAGQHQKITLKNAEAAATSRTLTFDKSHYSNVTSSGGNKWSYHWIDQGDTQASSSVGGSYLCTLNSRKKYLGNDVSKNEFAMIAFYNTKYKFNAITKIEVKYNLYQGDDASFFVAYITDSSGSYSSTSSIASVNSGGDATRTITVSNKSCYGIALKLTTGRENDAPRVRVSYLKVTYTC